MMTWRTRGWEDNRRADDMASPTFTARNISAKTTANTPAPSMNHLSAPVDSADR